MFTFTFDQTYFFDRRPIDPCWYVFTQPSTIRGEVDSYRHGYFDVSNQKFTRNVGDGRDFTVAQRQEIELILSRHGAKMGLEQFEPHETLPAHYREVGQKTNRYSKICGHLREVGPPDPNFSVAFEHLSITEPAYRLTRQFVLRVLAKAGEVSREERDEWLRENLLDTWTHD
ncbi:MAG: hypothetical protein KDA63_06055, partial [Planctomycetales bacterium]|nr:hypothetical protein [Planctomycetales bacterium]